MTDQVKFSQRLRGQKALVIGGSSGIGYAVAEGLLEGGAEVIISSSNQSRINASVEKLVSSYPSAKGRISGRVCNLGSDDTLESNIVDLLENVGRLDHVVFTAADSLAITTLNDFDITKMKDAGRLRFFAPLMLAKHAPKYLNGGPNSSITLTTGSVSQKPFPNWAVINAYATGLQGMTRGLALDLKPIRVNCVSPGVVDTELWSDEQRKTIFPGMRKALPTGVVPQPDVVAEAFLYAIKDTNCTGTMISTNGGALLV